MKKLVLSRSSYMRKIVLLVASAVTAMFGYGYSIDGTVLSVGEGEIVPFGSSDAATVAALTKIQFADGAGTVELKGGPFALSAQIAGAGSVKAFDAAGLTISGDSRGFTGGWLLSNSVVTVSSRYGFGDSGTIGGSSKNGGDYGVYCWVGQTSNKSPLAFSGNGLTNDVSVLIRGSGSDNIELNLAETGVMRQNNTFKTYKTNSNKIGPAEFNGAFGVLGGNMFYYFNQGSTMTFNQPVAWGGTWLYTVSGTSPAYVRLNAANNVWSEMNIGTKIRMVLGAGNALPTGKTTFMDANNNGADPAGYLDLNGHDQNPSVICRKSNAKPSENDGKYEVVTSAVPAKVTMSGTSPALAYYAPHSYRGKVSLRYEGQATNYLVNVASTSEGSLEVAGGTFIIDWGAQWGGTNVTVSGGELRLNSLNSLKDDTADLVVTGGTLTIGSGVTAFVSEATINNQSIARGSYTVAQLVAAYPVVEGYVGGTGALAVGQNQPEVETESFIWNGGAAPDTYLTTAGNWKGSEAPDFGDGSADLSFTEGTYLATAKGEQQAAGLHFYLAESFSFASEDDAELTLGKFGISVTNVSEDANAYVTNTINADIVNSLTAPGGISIGPRTVLELKGGYTGGAGSTTIPVAGAGEIVLDGDNSGLASPLFIAVPGEASSSIPLTVRVRSSTALGSTARTTTIVAPCIRFECLTNDVPLAVKGYGMVNSSFDGSGYIKRFIDNGRTLVMNGLIQSYGNIAGSWRMEDITLRGGFKDNGGFLEFYVFEGKECRIESAVDMEPATMQYSLTFSGGGTFRMSPAAHKYFRLRLTGGSQILCNADRVLLSGYPVCFGFSNEPTGMLNLNGHDQEIAFLSHAMVSDTLGTNYGCVVSGEAFGVVTSALPAVLTLNGTFQSQYNKGNTFSSPTNCAVACRGYAGLSVTGGEQWISFVKSDSKGDLHVSGGTLFFNRGGCWSGARNVLVDGTGVLKTDADSAACLLGEGANRSLADVRIGGSGALFIPSGSTVDVRTLKVGETDNAKFRPAGIYGGPGSGLDAAHTLSCITGGGLVNVRANGKGLVMSLK